MQILLKLPNSKTDTQYMEVQQRSLLHRQPVRIVPQAPSSVYTPNKQHVEKRLSSFIKTRIPPSKTPDTYTTLHKHISLKNFIKTALLRIRAVHCSPLQKTDKTVVLGIALMAGIVAIMLLATGSFARSESVPPLYLDTDPYITQLLIQGIRTDESIQADEIEPLPDMPISIELANYRVQRGDSLEKISRKFGVRIDTLISINKITNVKQLQAGTIIKIPNMDGIVHIVQKGDSLVAIAKKYKTDVITLADVNNLETNTLQAKQVLFIPGARLPTEELKRALGTFIQWPVRGELSSYFGYRPNPFTGITQFHNGIDIRANIGTSVKASIDGTVAETGYSTVYGNFIILKHSNGYQTLYGHLHKIYVSAGQKVTQSTIIGLTGNTGMTTGPHLHFSIFKNGKAINPLSVLGK